MNKTKQEKIFGEKNKQKKQNPATYHIAEWENQML